MWSLFLLTTIKRQCTVYIYINYKQTGIKMIKTVFRTNLDLINEEWPNQMPAVPEIGHLIRSKTRWSTGFQLRLEVCSVTWIYSENVWPGNIHTPKGDWVPEIELGIPKYKKMSVSDFFKWYTRLTKR